MRVCWKRTFSWREQMKAFPGIIRHIFKENRDKLRRYVIEYVVTGGGNKTKHR